MDPRRRELAKIHILAQQVGLDRDAYETLLHGLTGATSAAGLDRDSRLRVIARLRAQLPAPAPSHHHGAPHNIDARPMLGKIEALLAEGGKPWAYAEALARRIAHRDRLAFCSDAELGKVIAALHYDQARRRGARHRCERNS
jgi:phage gp16-like protein